MDAERQKWGWVFKEATVLPVSGRVALSWTLFFKNYRDAHDAGNLHGCFKPLEDALQDIRVLESDGPKHVASVTYGVEVGKDKAPLTILEITPSPAPSRPR